MRFYMPVLVFDETDCVRNHAAEFGGRGKKALIVTGRSSAKKNGSLDDVCEALASQETGWSLFDDVEENPSVETVVRAALFGKKEGCDFVVGIGGGSPLDAAKAIAFLMEKEEWSGEDLYDMEIPDDHLPVIAVPTTCGTGSEVTAVSVLTMHAKRTKGSIPHKIFPDVALIDGKYLASAPHGMLVNTSVDALAHMVESFFSVKADDYTRAVISAGLSLWGKSRDILTGERKPEAEDFSRMMRASAFAGMAIAQTGTSIPHALSYTVTYDEKVPHGKACGYFLPGFLEEAPGEDRAWVLGKAGFRDMEDMKEFFGCIYPDFTLPAEALERAFRTVSGNAERLRGCRFKIDEDSLRRIAGIE